MNVRSGWMYVLFFFVSHLIASCSCEHSETSRMVPEPDLDLRLEYQKNQSDQQFKEGKYHSLVLVKSGEKHDWSTFQLDDENKPYEFEKMWVISRDTTDHVVRASLVPGEGTEDSFVIYYFNHSGHTFAIEANKHSFSTTCLINEDSLPVNYPEIYREELYLYDNQFHICKNRVTLTDQNHQNVPLNTCLANDSVSFMHYQDIRSLMENEQLICNW